MANEIFKELKTRIALKYNTYEYWTTGEGKDYAPLKGEVCFCAIENKEQGAQTAPTVLFKVGVDGTKKFSELKWASALAADVYDWAKVAGGNVFEKVGSGNVISGIEYDETLNNGKGGFKYTTSAVATSDSLGEVQDAIAALQKDITDNRDAWVLDTDTRYSFSVDEKAEALVVKKTVYTNGVAGAEETVGTYEFLTSGEVVDILAGYYTKEEADAKFAPIGIDTGVHSVSLASGVNNGTVKLTVDGAENEVAVTGLGSAAYVTVESLNATAKGYADAVEAKIPTEVGVMTVTGADDTVVVDGDKNVTIKVAPNKFDAYGAAAAVLGTSTDGAAANTVYGAKAAAAAAQNDATIAKTKIETFLGTVTPDGSQDIIDTLAEINSYVGEHGEEFATLSGKVTNIENGTTVVPKAADTDTLDGHDSAYFATAESVSNISNNLGDLAAKDKIAEDDIDGTIAATKITNFATEVAAVKVTNAGHADNADKAADADKLGGQLPSYYATKDAIPGAIDSKISAYDVGKGFGDIITHNVNEFATSAQGEKADSAVQSANFAGTAFTKNGTELSISQADARTALGLGTAAYKAESDFQAASETLTNFAENWTADENGGLELNCEIEDENMVPSGIRLNLNKDGLKITEDRDGYLEASGYGISIASSGDTKLEMRSNGFVYTDRWSSNDKIDYTLDLPKTSGELMVAGSNEIVYILDCN